MHLDGTVISRRPASASSCSRVDSFAIRVVTKSGAPKRSPTAAPLAFRRHNSTGESKKPDNTSPDRGAIPFELAPIGQAVSHEEGKEEMSVIQGVGWLGVRTERFNEMLHFYREIMRLTPTVEIADQFALFDLPG